MLLGGVITQWLSWPWTFLINVPLGGLVLLLAPTVIRCVAPSAGRIDWIGAATIAAAVVTAVYAIVTTAPGQWTSTQTLTLLGIAALPLVIFLGSRPVAGSRCCRSGSSPRRTWR